VSSALTRLRRAAPSDLLRTGVLALAAVALAGTAVELATERHWNTALQLVPWAALGVLAVAQALLAVRPGRLAVRGARGLALLVIVTSLFGIVEHVRTNIEAGVLDATYGNTWDTLSIWAQLWYAATKTVGPAPPLAAGVLAQAALLTLLAAWRHPAIAAGEPGQVADRS
jgi:hypothetical protein